MRQNVRIVKLNGTRIQSQFIFLIEKSVFMAKITVSQKQFVS